VKARALVPGLALFVVSLGLVLTAMELTLRIGDFGFRPTRSLPNHDAVLERIEFRTRVVTNAQGFREPRAPGPKPPGVTRLVVVGDSFTQGYGVEEDEAYPRVLERLLDAREPQRRHEVINLGVPGGCTLEYVSNLAEVGLAYEPDLVLVGLMANDVHDRYALRRYGGRIVSQVLGQVQRTITDERPAWKRLPGRLWPVLYDYAGERLRRVWEGATSESAGASVASAPQGGSQLVPVERWEDVLLALAERYGRRAEVQTALRQAPSSLLADIRPVLTGEYALDRSIDETPLLRLAALVRPRSHVDMVLLPPAYDSAWAETMADLGHIAALAHRAGATTMVAYIPAAHQVNHAGWRFREEIGFVMDPATLTDTRALDLLREFGARANVRVIDLLAPLRAQAKEPIYYPIDGHWTPRGHRIAAEVLAAAIAP